MYGKKNCNVQKEYIFIVQYWLQSCVYAMPRTHADYFACKKYTMQTNGACKSVSVQHPSAYRICLT